MKFHVETSPTHAALTEVELTGKKTTMEILCATDSKEEILSWGRGFCQIFEYEHGSYQVIVLLESVSSGVYSTNIYIFGKSKGVKLWHLLLYRPTPTKVAVLQERNKLIFTNELTDTKNVILEQSFEDIWPVWEKDDRK